LQRYFLIALGGALGAILRYVVGAMASQRLTTRFPVGTLVINISACFIIGLTMEFLSRHTGASAAWRYLIPVGFIGAYSTFSTFEYEMWSQFTHGAYWIMLLYLTTSIVSGFLAVSLGASAGRALS